METIKTTLHAHLGASFAEIITSLAETSRRAEQKHLRQEGGQQGDAEVRLMDCLEVYQMIGAWREAEEVLRKYVRRKAEKVRISSGWERVVSILTGHAVILDRDIGGTP